MGHKDQNENTDIKSVMNTELSRDQFDAWNGIYSSTHLVAKRKLQTCLKLKNV